jgi:type I restriction enzyme, S subunit
MSEAGFVCIGQVAECFSGYPFESKEFCPPGEGEARVFRGDNLKEGCSEWGAKEKRWKAISPELEKYQLKQNDVLVGMDGSKVGKNWTRVDKGDLPALLGQRVCRIRAGEFADQDFIFHVFGSYDFKSYVECVKTGTSIPHISNNQIRDFGVFLPPLPEQKKIAEILSGIDNLIANKEKQISTLTTLQKSVLDALVEDQVSSEVPCLELSEVISPDRKITYGIVQAGPDTPGGIPYIRVTDMAGDQLETNAMLRTTKELADKFKRSEVQEGDIVVALRGIIGASHLIDKRTAGCNLTQGTALLSRSDKCAPRYMNAILKSEYCQNQFSFLAKGSTIIEITLSSLGTLRIPLPGRDSQEKITHIADAMQRDIKHGKTILDSYKNLKIALASDLLSGRKRVTI